jgi:NAD(P)H-dependent flavin oxidoreductase YrpB (nitropropane dioxygenase family)
MHTRVTKLIGSEFPVIAFTHCRDVAAAVSKAGGFGMLGLAGRNADDVRIELDWMVANAGGAPFGVDVLIPATRADTSGASIEEQIPAEHRQFVNDLLDRYGVPPLLDELAPSASGDMVENAVGMIDLALSYDDVRLVASALGPPPRSLVDAAHARDVPVAALVGKRQHALKQVHAGVDLIVAQGYEAGGHTGEIATMVLVPEIVDTVAPTPVVAAGGIASGRQMAAAMALGAEGVWTGSVWLTTDEAETHPVVVQKFLNATSSDTLRSRSSTGKHARQLRSAWTDEWERPENPDPLPMPLHGVDPLPMPLHGVLTREARNRIQNAAHRPGSGAEQLINYFVGQVVGSMNEVKPARRVLHDMIEEFADVMERLHHIGDE